MVQHLDGALVEEDLDPLAHEMVGHRVEVPFEFDVIVDVDAGVFAGAIGERFGGQGRELRRLVLHELAASGPGQLLEGTLVDRIHERADRLVEFGQREEHALAQRGHDHAAGHEHPGLHLGLVAGLAHPGGEDGAPVVGRQLGVGRVQVGLVAIRLSDPGLQVVADDDFGNTAEVGERPAVGREERVRAATERGLGVEVVARTHHRDEQVGRPHLACAGGHDLHRVTGPVHEQALAVSMLLAHHQIEAALPCAVAFAVPAVAPAVRFLPSVFTPEQLKCHVSVVGELRAHPAPVRLSRVDRALLMIAVEPALKLDVGERGCVLPDQSGCFHAC